MAVSQRSLLLSSTNLRHECGNEFWDDALIIVREATNRKASSEHKTVSSTNQLIRLKYILLVQRNAIHKSSFRIEWASCAKMRLKLRFWGDTRHHGSCCILSSYAKQSRFTLDSCALCQVVLLTVVLLTVVLLTVVLLTVVLLTVVLLTVVLLIVVIRLRVVLLMTR